MVAKAKGCSEEGGDDEGISGDAKVSALMASEDAGRSCRKSGELSLSTSDRDLVPQYIGRSSS